MRIPEGREGSGRGIPGISRYNSFIYADVCAFLRAVSVRRDGTAVAVTTNAVEIVKGIDIATPRIQIPRIVLSILIRGFCPFSLSCCLVSCCRGCFLRDCRS